MSSKINIEILCPALLPNSYCQTVKLYCHTILSQVPSVLRCCPWYAYGNVGSNQCSECKHAKLRIAGNWHGIMRTSACESLVAYLQHGLALAL